MILLHIIYHTAPESLQLFTGPDARGQSRDAFENARMNRNVRMARLYVTPATAANFEFAHFPPGLPSLPFTPRNETAWRPESGRDGTRLMATLAGHVLKIEDALPRFHLLRKPLADMERQKESYAAPRAALIAGQGDVMTASRRVSEIDSVLEVLNSRIDQEKATLPERTRQAWEAIVAEVQGLRETMESALESTSPKRRLQRAALAVALVRQWNPAFQPSAAWLETAMEGEPPLTLSPLPALSADWTEEHVMAALADASRVQSQVSAVENLQRLVDLPLAWEALAAVPEAPAILGGDAPPAIVPRSLKPSA